MNLLTALLKLHELQLLAQEKGKSLIITNSKNYLFYALFVDQTLKCQVMIVDYNEKELTELENLINQ